MKFFSDTRNRRSTAFVVLLVWLFALASGVANACLLATPELHSKAVSGSAPTTGQAPAELVVGHGASAGHGDDSDSTKESCLKVCDDGTSALPKAYAGVEHTDPGPAPLFATMWTGSPQGASALHRRGDLVVPIAGPPLRVRYSRLVL